MNNKRATKRALLTSVMALVMCVVMLVGTTFAWFTDTASTGVNKIQAGNLDVELAYKNAETMTTDTGFKAANKYTPVFKEGALWEPGHVEYVVLKVSNAGSLALKYKLGINIAGETGSTNVYGDPFKLSDSIKFAVIDGDKSTLGRDDLVAAATEEDNDVLSAGYMKEDHLVPVGKENATSGDASEKIVTLVVWMPTDVGNEANHMTGKEAPTIDLGIKVDATQYTYEKDSIDDQYDKDAGYPVQVNSENIQDYLDGKYGSIDGMTLVLAEGDYGTLELGRATKYPGSNTETYLLKSGDVLDAKTIDEIKETIATNPGGGYGTPCYIRSMSNVTFKAAVGAQVSVAGVYAFSGHRYQDGYDYVLDRDVVNGSNTYYVANRLTNITFDGITFTAKSNIETSQEQAIINGFTFKNCTFNIGHTENNSDYIALRYYNENNNGNVRNLVVDNCKFNNCRQGVYTSHVYGVSVTNSTFNTTGHNAIAIQDFSGVGNHGKVVITDNVFNNIGDRIIRFNNVGADTQITIKGNTATNSGDAAGEVIKATSLASGIKYDISGNNWGTGKTVANTEFADK